MKYYAIYAPKGSMCMSCEHAKRDCSKLHFSAMPVIANHGDTGIVLCSEFSKREKKMRQPSPPKESA